MAAYNSKVDTIYNHYLTSYAPKGAVSKYDSHKKDELRGVYRSMLKLNKDAPLYILDSSKESRSFVVNLKENARSLRNTIAELGGVDDDRMFSKKSAYSTDENMVSASFIGEIEDGDSAPTYDLEVRKLASNQENLGHALRSDDKAALQPGTYSFDIGINDVSYEFQFNIREDDTNRDIQERLARLVSKADIGIHADVLDGENGRSALRLSSAESGLKKGGELIFTISEDRSSMASGTVEYLGLNYVSKTPSNAEFLLNGEERSASSNHFTIDSTYEVTLNNPAPAGGRSARIGVKTDLDSITENVGNLLGKYNQFIRAAAEYREAHPMSTKLMNDMDRMVSYYSENFKNLGISAEKDGTLSLDERGFKSALAGDEDFSSLKSVKGFASSILNKSNQISLNPMEYVDKKIAAYKNPGHNFVAPYASSTYAGMFFNGYG
ncbi:MAG: flagellar filament capping protein FliD [Lachnospiraceae bacterium]|nr:flagellar filament capping protein FliD [Lachnospiraceae bacterium]